MYKSDLPPIPDRLRSLPVERGYPVPWFAALVDGKYDFRVIDKPKMAIAIQKHYCWICGQKLGTSLASVIGPMCAITRTISEPPSHRECAEWSIQACPFLAQRQEERRESHLPDGVQAPAGFGLKRQPGATLLWVTKTVKPFKAPGGGVLFDLGTPTELHWYCQGRTATRAEVLESIDSGYPILMEMAQSEGAAAVRELEARRQGVMNLLPSI